MAEMAENNGQRPYASHERRPFESRRGHEFYSYYESVLSHVNSKPKLFDLRDPTKAAAHQAVPSADKALTAFLQLAAIRIQTRRAMLFFFDSDHAYMIAESTQTLSLEDSSQHQISDSLWLGFTKIPRGFSVCEVTADLPANGGSIAHDDVTKAIVHIVNDLAEDTRFCDMPYVTGGPHARFYAGVPITTPNNLNIGVLCVLDDKPRDGLTLLEIEFLRGLSGTIMEHFETVRLKTDHLRSHAMTTALSAFVEGKSSSQQWWLQNGDLQEPGQVWALSPSEARCATEQHGAIIGSGLPDQRSTGIADLMDPSATSKPLGRQSPPTPPHSAVETESEQYAAPVAKTYTPSPDRKVQRDLSDSTDKNVDEANIASHVHRCTDRAAQLLQVALGADEVVLLDASLGKHATYHSGYEVSSDSESDTETAISTEARGYSALSRSPAGHVPVMPANSRDHASPPCKVLGLASRRTSTTSSPTNTVPFRLDQRTLRSLLRRYPRGHIWHFDVDAEIAVPPEDLVTASKSRTSISDTPILILEPRSPSSASERPSKLPTRARHRRLLQSCFPGIRSMIFLGMWNSYKESWFGALFAVTFPSMRSLSARSDLAYLAAFCDVLLAEIARMEAQVADQSKNDFISSISHEPRSPLHGILGSAKCLEAQSESHDVLSRELVRSITSSGITLLDILNDLLEYSRLSLGVQGQRDHTRHLENGQRSRRPSSEEMNGNKGSDKLKPEPASMLSLLTEAAVEAHAWATNIKDACDDDWRFRISGGSWKRICMNLVTNALKYTPVGYISVSLRKKWLDVHHGDERHAIIELVVEDSGVGMSEKFQADDLFRPFKQEDCMNSGTGLGLNLVAQIVRSYGGNVQIHSELGVGTCVKVILPSVSAPVPARATMLDGDIEHKSHAANLRDDMHDNRIHSDVDSQPSPQVLIFSSEDPTNNACPKALEQEAQSRQTSSLQKTCTSLGLHVRGTNDSRDEEMVVCIVHERDLKTAFSTNVMPTRAHLMQEMYRNDTALIVVCQTRAAALTFKARPGTIPVPSDAQFLWLPIGAVKLASTISACIAVLKNKGAGMNGRSPSDNASKQYGGSRTARGARNTDRSFFRFTRPELARHETQTATLSIAQILAPQEADSDTHNRVSASAHLKRPSMSRALTVPHSHAARKSNLLLVDDNVSKTMTISVHSSDKEKSLLISAYSSYPQKRAGYWYQTAENGLEALHIYKRSGASPVFPDDSTSVASETLECPRSRIEVVLLDLNMPVMNGFQVAKSIRQSEKASSPPPATIIAISALGEFAAQSECQASGIDLLLTKPVRYKEWIDVLGKLIRRPIT
ncbi:hypothetical protein LTR78_006101 [Recurvomyces mirabilis]|uniref:histidine kinase n=1 Tax=Recurvomyces mirabilis TaxID=574656 RepID=A0AAE1C0F2_9PEZI|nr:hypothetical protein LTR78_006101 [Recurvomyces mirabilis]KAK5151944.1 hypothetical protein LTS14_008718 [Recurvomyces mirabilis]